MNLGSPCPTAQEGMQNGKRKKGKGKGKKENGKKENGKNSWNFLISLISSSIRQINHHSQLSICLTTTHFYLWWISAPLEEGKPTYQDIFAGERKVFPGCSIADSAKSQSQKQWLPHLIPIHQNLLSQPISFNSYLAYKKPVWQSEENRFPPPVETPVAKQPKTLHGPTAAELPGAEFDLLPSSRDLSCAQLQVAAQSRPKPEFVTTLWSLMQLFEIPKSERNIWETCLVGKDTLSQFA